MNYQLPRSVRQQPMPVRQLPMPVRQPPMPVWQLPMPVRFLGDPPFPLSCYYEQKNSFMNCLLTLQYNKIFRGKTLCEPYFEGVLLFYKPKNGVEMDLERPKFCKILKCWFYYNISTIFITNL